MRNIGQIFTGDAPDERVALIDCRDWDNPVELTQRQIDQRANACARGLVARGLQAGDAVTILSANRSEFLIAYLGVLRAGMIAVPINFRFASDIIAFIMEDAGIKLAIVDGDRRGSLPPGVPVVDFDDAGPDGFEALLDPGPFAAVDPPDGAIATTLYTSGSTGRPKGVPLSHAGQIWTQEFRLKSGGPHDVHRLLVAAPLYHMNALYTSLFALGANASITLLPEFTVERYLGAIERFGCTWITSVPTMLAMCMAEPEIVAATDLSSVKIVRMGSAPVSEKLWARIAETFPGASVMNGYGTTEAGPVVFSARPGEPPPPLSVGWPAPGVRLKLVDESGQEADQGDLWHWTPAAMEGYLNLPEKSTEAFSEDGLYKSGDVFRRDPETGAYYFVGRTDDMFNCGGENIYPGEVEATLLAHPRIEMACVVPVPDEVKGMKPVAFVVPTPGEEITEAEVKQYALANAPAYRHPRSVTVLDDLPLAGPGKVDRKGLTQRARAAWEAAG